MSQILIELIKLANLIVTVAKAAASGNRIEAVLKMQPSLDVIDTQSAEHGANENTDESTDEPFIVFDGVSLRSTEGADEALEKRTICL